MTVADEPMEYTPRLSLRVYFGPEMDEAENAADLDRDPLPDYSDAEVEAFWAGRSRAARFSARVAA